MTVYLLHYQAAHPGNAHGARHYVGQAKSVEARAALHASGKSRACFTRSMAEHGIPFVIARTWQAMAGLERRIKRYGKARLLCPQCSGMAAMRRLDCTESVVGL